MLVGMLQADVDINAGIIAGGFIPGMQYSPTEVPFACWLVGGGCWRWFTLAFVLIYYYLWIKVERGPAKPINKKELFSMACRTQKDTHYLLQPAQRQGLGGVKKGCAYHLLLAPPHVYACKCGGFHCLLL